MTIEELGERCPAWLREAKTKRADVSITGSVVIWHGGEWCGGVWRGGVWCGGVWRGGVWRGGEWCGGVWRGGVWRDGVWCGGVWRDGVWRGGEWRGGVWCDGVWCDGVWCGGVWRGGEWRDENTARLPYMAALCGIVFAADGFATAYRTTRANGHGRHVSGFLQPEGEYREVDLPPAGSGTCVRGIHVATAARAHTYFGVDHTAQMWEVKFRREDLLDCDGEKARIVGGVFRKIPRPF